MKYLFGDSTESDLEFNYLAFLREVVDCAVVMVECDVTLAAAAERRRTRERETEVQLAAIAEFGKRASDFVAPVAKQEGDGPVGRCAAAIATAIREAVEFESATARAKLAADREELAKDGSGVLARTAEALGKLLRTHDLPAAEKELQVAWTGAAVKATMRQRTSFGVEAVLALEVPVGSLLGPDLRVDRVADGVEVHVREAGGWLKKGDKLVSHKLGRYHVVGIAIAGPIRIELRAEGNNAGGMVITAVPSGDMRIEATGSPARDVVIEERDRQGLRTFVDRIEAAARALADSRAGVVSILIDGKSIGDHGNPRVLAERLTAAIAPTVTKIKQRSRSPGELVLRRLLGDNRREEIFVSIDELVKRVEVLPVHARGVFAPLQLQGEAAPELPRETRPAPKATDKPADKPADKFESKTAPDLAKPFEAKPFEAKPEVKPIEVKAPDIKAPEPKSLDKLPSMDAKTPEPKDVKLPAPDVKPLVKPNDVTAKTDEPRARRISQVPMPDRGSGRTSPPPVKDTQPFGVPTNEVKRPKPPTPPPPAKPTGKPVAQDFDEEEWPSIARDQPFDDEPALENPPHGSSRLSSVLDKEPAARTRSDSAVPKPIDPALDEDTGSPPAK